MHRSDSCNVLQQAFRLPRALNGLKKRSLPRGSCFFPMRRWTAGAAVAACVLWPDEVARFHLLEVSLAYPAWYMWLSVTRGGFDRTNG